MSTANRIIRMALARLGVVAPGEPVKPNDAADCLIELNAMLDAWRVDSLFAVSTSTITGALPGNTQTRTIGPTGQIVATPRPIRLEDGCFYTYQGLDYPLQVVTEAEFNGIQLKNVGGLGPTVVFYDPSFPVGTLKFYPLSSSGVDLSLVVLQQLAAFADLTTNYNLPPGYELCIALSLADSVATYFERELPVSAQRQGQNLRRMIKSVNLVVPQLDTVPASPPQGRLGAFLAG